MTYTTAKVLKIQTFLNSLLYKHIYYKDISWKQQIDRPKEQKIFTGSMHILISQRLSLIITIGQNYEFHVSLNNDSIVQSRSLGAENGYEIFLRIQDVVKYSYQIKEQLEQMNTNFSLIFDIIEEVKKILEE